MDPFPFFQLSSSSNYETAKRRNDEMPPVEERCLQRPADDRDRWRKRMRTIPFGFGLMVVAVSFVGAGDVNGANQNNPEARLRETLRSTMLQLRDAQNQVATLQAAQAENDKEKKTLSDQIATLAQHAKEDKEATYKTIADLNTKISDQEKQIAQLKDVLTKWKESQKQAVDLANAKEAARAKLAANNILLQRRIDDAETRNAQMFKLGNESLNRYERFGLGDALTAREPFVGTTRIKFKNLVQDYQDKLTDQKIKPESASAKPQQTAPVQGNSPVSAGGQQPQNTAATKSKPE